MNAIEEATPSALQAAPLARRIVLGATALIIATAIWIPLVHVPFAPRVDARERLAKELAARHLELWTDPAQRAREIERMRGANAEWDFMGRSFLVWSLGEIALRDPSTKAANLEVMDRIIAETLERERGVHFFLMSYSRMGAFRVQPPRSLFVDGEIALMLGVRRLVEERDDYKRELATRVRVMEERSLDTSRRRRRADWPGAARSTLLDERAAPTGREAEEDCGSIRVETGRPSPPSTLNAQRSTDRARGSLDSSRRGGPRRLAGCAVGSSYSSRA